VNTVANNEGVQFNYAINYKKWLVWPAYILFFMMLFVPTTYQPIKAVLLAMILLTIGTGALVRGRLHLHMWVLLWTLLMVVTGLAFMSLGMVNNAPGALRVGTVYVLWPLVYTLLVSGISGKRVVDGIFKVMIFSLIAISIYSISYLLYVAGWLPHALYIDLNMGQAVGFYGGYVEYNLYNISSLNYLVPFVLAMLFVNHKRIGVPISRLWLWVSCLLGIVVAILSGRRAVWLILAISPMIVIVMRMFLSQRFKVLNRRKVRRFLVAFPVIAVVLALLGIRILGLNFSVIFEQLVSGFNFVNGGASESARAEQFFALMNGWMDSPLFGAGHGASVAGSLRSVKMSWAYELSYVALLFHTGIVGFFIYSAGVIWAFWMGLKIVRSGHWLGVYMLPTLVGTACFLIANSTNPYLAKFDYIWVIFLPVSLINLWLLDKSKITQSEGQPCPHH